MQYYFAKIILNMKHVCIINAWGCTEILLWIICKYARENRPGTRLSVNVIQFLQYMSDLMLANIFHFFFFFFFARVAGYEEFTPYINGEFFEWIIINIVRLYSSYW